MDSAMRVVVCCLIIAFLGTLPSCAADERANELRGLLSGSKDGIIRLNDETFGRFVKGLQPRTYGIVLFFDAVRMHGNHELKLPGLRKEFSMAAKAYATKYLADDDASRSDSHSPVFFCDIEFGQSEKIFHSLSINSLPMVRFFPPGAKSTKAVEMDFQKLPQSAEGFVAFLKSAAAVDVGPIERPPAVSKQQMGFLGAVLIVIAPFVIRFLVTRHTPFHEPSTWCIFGLAIYFFSVSGGMFNIIRGMPMFVPDHQRPGKFTYFYSGGGAQFGVEGFTLGALYTVVGLLAAFVTYVAPKIRNGWVQRPLLLLALAVAAASVRQVVQLDNRKTGYSIHGFWPKAW